MLFPRARLSTRQAGAFAFIEAPGLGLVVQWDYGTRIYIRLSSRWKGQVSRPVHLLSRKDMDRHPESISLREHANQCRVMHQISIWSSAFRPDTMTTLS